MNPWTWLGLSALLLLGAGVAALAFLSSLFVTDSGAGNPPVMRYSALMVSVAVVYAVCLVVAIVLAIQKKAAPAVAFAAVPLVYAVGIVLLGETVL